jgi:hypothetical protein
VNQHATIEEAVFSVGFVPRLYNEDFMQLELGLRESPELAVGRIMARKELDCAKKTSQCAEVIDCYESVATSEYRGWA